VTAGTLFITQHATGNMHKQYHKTS